MKVIASNIFDFTTWYKFGYKHVPNELIIDLSDLKITGDELLCKVGFFEEDYEVFFLEIPESKFPQKSQSVFLSSHDIVSLIPLSDKGANLLFNKIPDFKISKPIQEQFAIKLFEARNRYLAINGAYRLLSSFKIEVDEVLKNYENLFISSLQKYFNDLNAEQDSILDYIIFYERSKPYPLTDLGFLYDVGGIAMNRFNLSEEDFINRTHLKKEEPHTFELIEEVIALSKTLKSIQEHGVFRGFINEYGTNELLQNLSSDLSLVKNADDKQNNILIIGLYLKFRYMIRNTYSLEDSQFTETINLYLKNVPTETKIALYLVGMFFGALKFKELYYKYVPLHISRHKFIQPAAVPIGIEIIEKKKKKEKNSTNNVTEVSNISLSEMSNQSQVINTGSFVFDINFWGEIEPIIQKFSIQQKKIIKDSFMDVVKEGGLYDTRPEYFISILQDKAKKSKAKKTEEKISPKIIAEVQGILSQYFSLI